MRIKSIIVSDHALLRWRERVVFNSTENIDSLIETIKKARIIKKTDQMPYLIVRKIGIVYAIFHHVLFILEPTKKDEYKVITVITLSHRKLCDAAPLEVIIKKEKKIKNGYARRTQNENFELDVKSSDISKKISSLPRSSKNRKKLLDSLEEIRECMLEKNELNHKSSKKDGMQIYKELYEKKYGKKLK